MKRFWIGLSLLAVILIGGLWINHRMSRIHMPCAVDLERAAACALEEDWTGAAALADRARETWQKNWRLNAAMTDHQAMDEIDAFFEELEVYRSREETTPFSAACLYLAQRMKDIGYSFRFTLWNLL